MKLRPHHGLCLHFFEGKGYSAEFTENMGRIADTLKAGDPPIELTLSADIICAVCPHNIDGACDSADKVARYDNAVLRAAGLEQGSTLRWSELSQLVSENILSRGKLNRICGDCAWFDICRSKSKGGR
ncbi:MAG: DUF1284 domain-containing protein [Ruminococcus sp.]|nr:DUF1284 domain-containing protein [Ruminococcus sp.]